MKRSSVLIAAVLLLLVPCTACAGETVVAKSKPDLSLKLEVENAIGRGLTWLAGKQTAGGFWSQAEYPASTGLVLTSFQGDPSGFHKEKYQAQIRKGYGYLLKNVKPDGGIYGKDLANYNTSISMMALLMANQPEYEPVIKKARAFEIALQDHLESGDPLNGGIGYGGSYKHSDLANTSFALEAIHYTRYLKSDVANDADGGDLNWKAALQFVSRCQNLPGSNDQKWAAGDPANKGGVHLFPG